MIKFERRETLPLFWFGNMKKYLIFLFLIFILSCSWKNTTPKDWTILIYMAADNSLSSAAVGDIAEMQEANIPDNVNLIIQADFGPYNENPEARRFKIENNNLKTIKNLGEIDSGDYTELSDFISWGKEKYPADRSALIIWSHGNGWMAGYNKFCPDTQTGNFINITEGELASAFRDANSDFDILAFDACNMLSIEVVAEIDEYSDFILGSERGVPQDGFPYDEILPHFWNYSDTNIISNVVIDSYVNSHMPYGSQNPHGDDYAVSGAVLCSAEFNQLQTKISDFCNYNFTASDIAEIFEIRDNIELEFNDLHADVDLENLFSEIEKDVSNEDISVLCQAILDQIELSFSVQYFHDGQYPNVSAGSASIWFPENPDTYKYLSADYNNLSFPNTTNWSNFISYFFAE